MPQGKFIANSNRDRIGDDTSGDRVLGIVTPNGSARVWFEVTSLKATDAPTLIYGVCR